MTMVLICDDDPVQRRLLAAAVVRLGYQVKTVSRLADCRGHGADGGDRPIDAAVVAIDGPWQTDSRSHEALSELAQTCPVIVQVAPTAIDMVAEALRLGAVDFVTKPICPQRLSVSLINALKRIGLEREASRQRRVQQGRVAFDDIVALSPAMDKAIKLGQRAAATHNPVMLEGERGVGKALLARAIQGSGDLRSKPFVVVDCAALTEENAISILFGDGETSARDGWHGRIGEARGGTLFLDAVDHLPRSAQPALLKVLDRQEPGDHNRRRFRGPFRVISAANGDLLDRVRRGRFREDLYYRLNVYPIRIPPLRERTEDVLELARHFLVRFAAEEGKTFVMGLDEAAATLLSRYDWPGNVAQLESALFHAVALADAPLLSPKAFPRLLSARADTKPVLPAASPGGGDRRAKGQAQDVMAFDRRGDIRRLSDIEAEMVRLAVGRYGGRMTMVARKLGIGRSTLYRKLRDLGLLDDDVRTAAE